MNEMKDSASFASPTLSVQRIAWVDVCKGYGIFLVVVAHIQTGYLSDVIFLFHMPLFFFISGYLYKRNDNLSSYLKKKILHLGIPYVSFLLLLNVPEYLSFVKKLITSHGTDNYRLVSANFVGQQLDQLYGGINLYGKHSIFWFVSCLFITQQLYNYIFIKTNGKILYLSCCSILLYIIAMVDSIYFRNVFFPLSANVVAMAFPFFFFGYLLSIRQDVPDLYAVLSVVIILVSLVISYCNISDISFSMKAQNYGLPVLSILISLGFILLSVNLSKYVFSHNLLSNTFMELGRASMVIMFMHQGIQLFLKQYRLLNGEVVRILISLTVSYLLYRLFNSYNISRFLFLGVKANRERKIH